MNLFHVRIAGDKYHCPFWVWLLFTWNRLAQKRYDYAIIAVTALAVAALWFLVGCSNVVSPPDISGSWSHNDTEKNIYLKLYSDDSLQGVREELHLGVIQNSGYYKGTFTEQVIYRTPLWDTPIDTAYNIYRVNLIGEKLRLIANDKDTIFFRR